MVPGWVNPEKCDECKGLLMTALARLGFMIHRVFPCDSCVDRYLEVFSQL